MAKRATANEGTEKLTNVKARAQTIRAVFRELSALEAKRDTITGEIRELLKNKIKGDLNMLIGDFRAAYRLYGLDDEKRDIFFDNLRETFEALGKGDQLDFIGDLRRSAAGIDPADLAAAPQPASPEAPEQTY